MKIYNQELKMESTKIILSQDPFNLIHNINSNNDGTIIIAPWSKFNDLFNHKKNNFLHNMLIEEYENLSNKILNHEMIVETIEKIEKEYQFNFIDFDQKSY